jgi:hypothetical protein
MSDPKLDQSRNRATREKSRVTWQEAQWARFPSEKDWPARMDVYLAAAYCRINPDTLRRAMTVGRDGRALLAHQRFGAAYRIRKEDLDAYGRIHGRN